MDYSEAVARLGLEQGASGEEVRAAHSRLAKQFHPDAGGSTAAMAALNEARDVALENADANGEAMVPMSVVRDLMRTQTGLVRDQAERREATDRAQRAIVKYEVDRLERRRRVAGLAATISGGLGLLIGFLRAAVLSGVGELQSERFALVIAVIAFVAGAFALIAWILGVRVKSFEHLVNDASDALSDRGTFLEVIAEIEERSGKGSPWLRGKLHEAISAWIDEIGLNVRGSVAELAHRIGPEYFAKLLVAKGLELEVMEEKIGSPDGGLRIEYVLVWQGLGG
jgi:hypothetical protein